jgi:hypothetical protein
MGARKGGGGVENRKRHRRRAAPVRHDRELAILFLMNDRPLREGSGFLARKGLMIFQPVR